MYAMAQEYHRYEIPFVIRSREVFLFAWRPYVFFVPDGSIRWNNATHLKGSERNRYSFHAIYFQTTLLILKEEDLRICCDEVFNLVNIT